MHDIKQHWRPRVGVVDILNHSRRYIMFQILQVPLHPQLVQKQRNRPRRSLPSQTLPLPAGGQLARRTLQLAAADLRLRAARSRAHLRRSQKPTSL